MSEHPKAEDNRQYGELYYHSSAVATLLRLVAEHLLEADDCRTVLELSHDLPTHMHWDAPSRYALQRTADHGVYRTLQLEFFNNPILGMDTVRLACLLRRGPSPVYTGDGIYDTGQADGHQDTKQ